MKNLLHFLLMAAFVCGIACSGGGSTSVEATTSTGSEEPAPVVEAPPPPAEPAPPVDPDDVHIEGDHVTIDQMIQFEVNSDVILGESAEIIDHLATFLNNHQGEIPGLRVIGHTDQQGSARSNQDLSERRAAAVVEALRSRSVTVNLVAEGKGMTQRVCTEDTDECHARNRRVEFVVVAATE